MPFPAETPLRIALAENIVGRDFVVSDIHGYFGLLEQELVAQKFNPAQDRVIAVGDLIDRGPDSSRALEFLANPWFFSVRGNHEQAMLDWMEPMLAGNAEAVRENAARHVSFGGDWIAPLLTRALRGEFDDIVRWRDALSSLPIAISISRRGEKIGVIHATVPGGDWLLVDSDAALSDLPPIHARTALWARRPLADMPPPATVSGIDRVYVGHNVVDGRQQIGNLHMIETGAWLGRGLTVLNIDEDAPNIKSTRISRWL